MRQPSMNRMLAMILALQLGGCASGAVEVVAGRAVYDLGCETSEIQVAEIPGCAFIARGCGGEATYVVRSNGGVDLFGRCCPPVGCTAELESKLPPKTSTSAAAAAAGPPTSRVEPAQPPPPLGAAGFTFDADAKTSEKICTDAGHAWKVLSDGYASCSQAPSNIGFPASVSVELCSGKVCKIIVDAAIDGSPWLELANRYANLKEALDGKYGHQATQSTAVLDDCSEKLSACFKKGRTKSIATWTWPSKQMITLTLSGGAPGSQPVLTVEYHAGHRAPKGMPNTDAL